MRSLSYVLPLLLVVGCSHSVVGTGHGSTSGDDDELPSSGRSSDDGDDDQTSASGTSGFYTPSSSDPTPSESLDLKGTYCGHMVTDASDCGGDEVGYLRITSGKDPIVGQLCEAYGKDCTPIENGQFQGAVGFFTFETTTAKGKLYGQYRVTEEGDLVGDRWLMTGSHVSSPLFRVR